MHSSSGRPFLKKWYRSRGTGVSIEVRTEDVPVSRSISTVRPWRESERA